MQPPPSSPPAGPDLRSRFRGCLLAGAAGDALGAVEALAALGKSGVVPDVLAVTATLVRKALCAALRSRRPYLTLRGLAARLHRLQGPASRAARF